MVAVWNSAFKAHFFSQGPLQGRIASFAPLFLLLCLVLLLLLILLCLCFRSFFFFFLLLRLTVRRVVRRTMVACLHREQLLLSFLSRGEEEAGLLLYVDASLQRELSLQRKRSPRFQLLPSNTSTLRLRYENY